MATAPFGNNPEKVKNYEAFWELADVKRPLVGFSLKSWFPLMEFEASAKWQDYDYLTPEMIEPEAFVDDQERLLREGEEIEDDIFRGASPSQAVPWLCAMLQPFADLPESILGEDMDLEWDEIEDLELDKENPWLRSIEFTKVLVKSSAEGDIGQPWHPSWSIRTWQECCGVETGISSTCTVNREDQ